MTKNKIKVALVGSPNVGKSVIFNALTNNYATVSNYPGTTVSISRGTFKENNTIYEIIDTPGMYSLTSITEEEKISKHLLKEEKPDIIIHVADAKNLPRMLSLTLDLLEKKLPVILNLNIIDEAQELGIYIDTEKLSTKLNIPVGATLKPHKNRNGILSLKNEIINYKYQEPANISYKSLGIKEKTNSEYAKSLKKQAFIKELVKDIFLDNKRKENTSRRCLNYLGKIACKPLPGTIVLLLVLYFGLYQFVGKFGAGFLVDYFDTVLFQQLINPVVINLITTFIPSEFLQSLLIGNYGVISLGLRYAIAIILPIISSFFLAFAILEDSGYLPRLAMLADSFFKKIGLNGRAVIPMTLGLGCGTMAIFVSRTLETKRERKLAIFLLALTIPCSAQLGLVLALLSHNQAILICWASFIIFCFFFFGWLSNKILPGNLNFFYIEIPPLRIPTLRNVLKKVYMRVVGYFLEIVPIFIAISLVLFSLDQLNLLASLISSLAPILSYIGLPPESAESFVLGFFRRDYGSAGLYDLARSGILSDTQLLIGCIALTLFVPCVAQLAVMIKEIGKITSAMIVSLVFIISFFASFLMYSVLTILGF